VATTIERRLRALEAAQEARTDHSDSAGSPEDCCSSFGYTLEQAVAEFGSFPAFCHGMLMRSDPTFVPPGGDAFEAYRAACR